VTTPVVLDASAGVELLLDTPTGEALRANLPRPAVEWVPEIYHAAVLRRGELAGRIPTARAAMALGRLLAAPHRRVQVKPLLAEAWALRHNIIVSDALYVVLARHLRAPLVTADLNLVNAPGLGVTTIRPPRATGERSSARCTFECRRRQGGSVGLG
jgi:predicted nucleic acid-binding protein